MGTSLFAEDMVGKKRRKEGFIELAVLVRVVRSLPTRHQLEIMFLPFLVGLR